jgi:CDP-glucose 4,6-dehydratase
VADIAAAIWGEGAEWTAEARDQPHESGFLTLDSNKSKSVLNWKERLTPNEAIAWSVEWSRRQVSGESAKTLTLEQLSVFALR